MESLNTSILLLIIFNFQWETVNSQINQNYICERGVCYPEDYDRLKKPQDQFTIYVNFYLSGKKALKNIDVEKMVIRFKPRVAMAWEDPRLKIKDFKTDFPAKFLDFWF